MSISKIQTITVGSGGIASIDFNSIPGTYTDLMIQVSVRSTAASTAQTARMLFNGSSANSVAKRLLGTGSSVQSNAGSYGNELGLVDAANNTANTFTSMLITIPNYAGATNKSYSIDTVMEDNATTAYAAIYAGLWSQTAAITSLSIYPDGGNWAQYSSATLYGITKGSSGGVTVS